MQWSELRHQAKALESELDLKLTDFGKVGSSCLSGSAYNRAPHITESSTGQSYGDICNDIESLLQRLVFWFFKHRSYHFLVAVGFEAGFQYLRCTL